MKKKCFQKLLCCCLAAFVFLGCMDVCGREMSKVQAAKTGWVARKGKQYYYKKDGTKAKGLVKINGKRYFFDQKTGEQRKGFITWRKKTYYFCRKGYAVTGLRKIGRYRYYFNGKGVMYRNSWVKNRYYAGKNGRLYTGFRKINGRTYYFDKTTGQKVTGWKKIGNKTYYFNYKGILYHNRWVKDTYYVDDDGARVKGWLNLGGETYYLHPRTGKNAVGWTKIKGEQYYFNQKGVMQRKRWVNGRYLGMDGKMAKNTYVGRYYVGEDGKKTGKTRKTGFFTENGKTWYLDANYEEVTGWIELKDGRSFHFDEETGVMDTDQWVDGFYLGEDGAKVEDGFFTVDGDTYLFDEDGYRRTGLVIVSMKTYYLDDKGILQTGFRVLDGVTHYFDPEDGGAMAVSKGLLIKGSYYLFDADGYIYARAPESSEEAKGVQIVMYAQQFIGNPYAEGGTSLTEGADASGFTQSVMAKFGIQLPRSAKEQGNPGSEGQKVSVEDLKPGDLIYYENPKPHVGIYMGSQRVLHASDSRDYPVGGIKVSAYNFRKITSCIRYW